MMLEKPAIGGVQINAQSRLILPDIFRVRERARMCAEGASGARRLAGADQKRCGLVRRAQLPDASVDQYAYAGANMGRVDDHDERGQQMVVHTNTFVCRSITNVNNREGQQFSLHLE